MTPADSVIKLVIQFMVTEEERREVVPVYAYSDITESQLLLTCLINKKNTLNCQMGTLS